MTADMNMPETERPRVVLRLDEKDLSALFWLLQSGFFIDGVEAGCSVKSFLIARLGMSEEYIRHSISTVFLDGMPVDDLDTAILRDGSRLALSSALPGLVGATMRSGGALASLRSSITYKETAVCAGGNATVHVKLFNMVMEQAGPYLLQRGILVAYSDLQTFLRRNTGLIESCPGISLNGKPVDAGYLIDRRLAGDGAPVMLSVIFGR